MSKIILSCVFALIFETAYMRNPAILHAPHLYDGRAFEMKLISEKELARIRKEKEQLHILIEKAKYEKHRKYLARKIPQKYQSFVFKMQVQLKHDIPYSILYNLILNESGWQETIISKPNRNGSRDVGLGQLNEANLPYFEKVYYTGRQKFNPYNGFHNLEITMKYLSNLYRDLRSWKLAVQAYNCGYRTVLLGKVPESTLRYSRRIVL